MSGKLYLVATPIGNLEDITIRAIRILKEVEVIIAEDTRHTLQLLNHLEINKKLISYHRHSEENKREGILKLLKEGKNMAVVSDAGTPVISDPGENLVKEAIKQNIEVVPIPGPCALITALIASGLDTTEFVFFGFLPVNKKNRNRKLEEIYQETKTIIVYEAPHKLVGTLKELENVLGERQIVLAKELTKLHESYLRGNIHQVLEEIQEPKGEYVILIEGANKSKVEIEKEELIKKSLEEHYLYYAGKGIQKKEIIKKIARDREVNKNEIYQYFLKK